MFYETFITVSQHLYGAYDYPKYRRNIKVSPDNPSFNNAWFRCFKLAEAIEKKSDFYPQLYVYAYLRERRQWLPTRFSELDSALNEWIEEIKKADPFDGDCVSAYSKGEISMTAACKSWKGTEVADNPFDQIALDMIKKHVHYYYLYRSQGKVK